VASSTSIVPASSVALAIRVPDLLLQVRSEWKAKSIIERVQRLLEVDPSSACQRVFNAAVHDLRAKIVAAGLDIAKEAALANKLPPVTRADDILDGYSVSNTLDLAYRMGLLTRPDWKRIRRAYEIRGDLEHEDDEYEAQLEDLFYIFKTSIEIVLSRDPFELLRVDDVKAVVDAPSSVALTTEFIQGYEHAPEPRQKEIAQFLVNAALDDARPDVTRVNAVAVLRQLEPLTRDTVKIELAKHVQDRAKKTGLTVAQAKVASAGGFFAYLKQSRVHDLFKSFIERLEQVGPEWQGWKVHGDILDELEELGGPVACSAPLRPRLVVWMVRCFIGEPSYGRSSAFRYVYYSNSGAPRVSRMVKAAGAALRDDIVAVQHDPTVTSLMMDKHVARRFEQLVDLTGTA
jgi:hypothetical protein